MRIDTNQEALDLNVMTCDHSSGHVARRSKIVQCWYRWPKLLMRVSVRRLVDIASVFCGTVFSVCLLATLSCDQSLAQPSGEFSGREQTPVGVTSTDVLRRYLTDLAVRHNLEPPSDSLLTRNELGTYFMKMMPRVAGLPSHQITEQDYRDIGYLSEEFDDVFRVVKGKLAIQAYKSEVAPAAHISDKLTLLNDRVNLLEKVKVSGDFAFQPQTDSGKTDRDSTAVNLRSRVNVLARVYEASPDSTLQDGYLYTRLTAAAGRFFPRNKYLLSPINDLVDANASPYNSGLNEVQLRNLIINNNNSNSLRPTFSLEQAYYSQDLRWSKNWKGNYKAGLIYFGNMFDNNNYANSESLQFINTQFVNSISWRPNFNGPATVFQVERSLLRDKAFARLTGGITSLTNRDYFGSVGGNYEFQLGHRFKEKEGNLRVGFWNFNFRGGSPTPFVTPVDISGTSVLSLIPGGVTTGSRPCGMYMNFDQKVWKNIGLWGRYAFNDKQIGEVLLGGLLSSRASWSTGLEIPMSSFFKKRPDDVLGIAYGQVLPYSREAVTPATPAFLALNGEAAPTTLAGVNANLAQINPGRHHRGEKTLEAYYRFQLNKNVSVSPDVQYIWSPGGTGPQPGIFVLGSRLFVQF
ncbi:MAG: carbohydrate porin [Candidatus Obscuribacterales bacterium]|nr:carbohydrate porin [Candidatus Obscuribacterales bacterium]